MLRSLPVVVAVVVGLVAAACSSPDGASSSWSLGPSLPPASGDVSAPASPSAVASAAASPVGDATPLTIGTRTGTELEFEPDEVSVPAGIQVSVTFENRASLPHNLTFSAPIGVATSTVVEPGASETIEFDAPEPGDYEFVCTLHPGMAGTLSVESAS